MKKKMFSILLVCCLALTGCSSTSNYATSVEDSSTSSNGAGFSIESSAVKNDFNISQSEDYNNSEVSSEQEVSKEDDNNSVDTKFDRDMLVYEGSIRITTKSYDKAISELNELYKKYDCFISSSTEYQNYDELMNYSATIRVNSSQYEDLMNGVSNLGTLARKTSEVTNMSMEYSDIVTALRIYKARQERYLKMLENCYDESDAIAIEDKLTDLEVTIAQYESRKALIETDVAYSYINLEIEEVKEYTSQVNHTDGFFTRFRKEVVNTFFGFIDFLENALFFVIRIVPYGVLFFILYKVLKKLGLLKKLPKIRKKKKPEIEVKSETK